MTIEGEYMDVREQYAVDGYVRISPYPGVLLEQCTRLDNQLDELLQNRKIKTKWKNKDGNLKQLVDVHRHSEVVAEIIQSEALQEILSDLYPGVPMFVTHSKISLKFPESKQIWLPHQDIVYKKDKELQGASICIFLEDIDPQNGALTLHRGSHKNGPLEHKITFIEDETEPQIECDTSEEQERVQITGHKGDVCVFDLRTIHESGINKGSGRRAMLIFDVLEIGKDGFMEENGKDAIAYNVGDLQNHLLPRILTFTRNILIVPMAKRALYGLHKLGIRNLKM